MDVILLEKIRNLGQLGDQVKVKAGYARNFLIPHGKAIVANEANKARFAARRAELEQAQADALTAARSRAEKMEGATVQILRKASEDGKLFGSVGTADIAEALTQSGFPAERSEIELPHGAIKAVGDYDVSVSLHPEVATRIHVSVVGEA
jgi:large subunit ribosomal protein L9